MSKICSTAIGFRIDCAVGAALPGKTSLPDVFVLFRKADVVARGKGLYALPRGPWPTAPA